MARSDLFIDMSYVPHWGIVEAVREIFQNSHDAEVSNAENKMFFNYDKNTGILYIGNKLSVLSKKSMLIGCSSKRGKANLIGEQGEGYKLATIILLRTGHSLTIYNYDANEIWQAKVIKSTKYKTQIASFDITPSKTSKYENSLVFKIGGISEEEYKQIVDSNLYLLEKEGRLGKVHKTIHGDLLADNFFKGKIFVEGLFVCSLKGFEHGYNLKAENVTLNRDRNLLDTFDVKWECSRIARMIPDGKIVADAIMSGEAKFYSDISTPSTCSTEPLSSYEAGVTISDVDYGSHFHKEYSDNFIEKYGESAYPVCSESEKEVAENAGYNPVIVSQSEKAMITKSEDFKPVASNEKASPVKRLESLFERINHLLPEEDYNEFADILDELKKSN